MGTIDMRMRRTTVVSKPRLLYVLMLLTAAFIFGFSFVVMHRASAHLNAFAFNGITWLFGGLVVLPQTIRMSLSGSGKQVLRDGTAVYYLIAGLTMFSGMTLLQMGITYTTAGKAGFITGLYVVIVPVLDFFIFRRSSVFTWMGVTIATGGLYLLFSDPLNGLNLGDLLILGAAFFWSAHFHVLSWAGDRLDSTLVMMAQCAVVGGMSLLLALFQGGLDVTAIAQCSWEILYAGLVFVGLGSLMEVHAIRNLPPSIGAVVLSLESVFAVLTGWLVLGETMSHRAIVGCTLMLAAIFIVQLKDAGSRVEERTAPYKGQGAQRPKFN